MTEKMIFKRILYKHLLEDIKRYSTKKKPNFEVNSEVVNNIESGLFKPRKHPGIFKPTNRDLPVEFVKAAEKAFADYPVKQILNDSHTLCSYLQSRHPPMEHNEIRKKKLNIESKVYSEFENKDLTILSEEQINHLKNNINLKIKQAMRSQIYHWEPVNYDINTSLQYLVGRSAAEYAVLTKIFHEISTRNPNFKPRSFFDFGSGVGTATWAAKQFWKKHIFEYFNVDASAEMNDLALILLKGGTGTGSPNLKGVFYRQFLPATNTSYDLVVSAYSLFELPSSQARLETLIKLWNKTEHYLVLVEQGTNAGFKLISEAREFILEMNDKHNVGHCFSPCPHEEPCPRYLTDVTPCNFELLYSTIPIGQNSVHTKERYCYVVLKKGKPDENMERWPRIVRPTLKRSRHVICRMCTNRGKLEEIIFTPTRHGKTTYRCAKASKWGDLLPITVLPEDETETETEITTAGNKKPNDMS